MNLPDDETDPDFGPEPDDFEDDLCRECDGTGLSWDGLGECPYCQDGYQL